MSGALDVIAVVDEASGDIKCTPFHVRFGKLKVNGFCCCLMFDGNLSACLHTHVFGDGRGFGFLTSTTMRVAVWLAVLLALAQNRSLTHSFSHMHVFHVLIHQVLRSREKRVYLSVNGEQIDVEMKVSFCSTVFLFASFFSFVDLFLYLGGLFLSLGDLFLYIGDLFLYIGDFFLYWRLFFSIGDFFLYIGDFFLYIGDFFLYIGDLFLYIGDFFLFLCFFFSFCDFILGYCPKLTPPSYSNKNITIYELFNALS